MTRLDVTDPKNSTPAPLLEYRDVVKSYGQGDTEVVALRQIDLAVAAGEVVAIMGPSGYGKSTLLHLAGVLEAPRREACC